jgi:Glycosyltransferase family 87
LSPPILLLITIVLMAKFYAHELLLGQANLLLGALLLAALVAVQSERPLIAGALVGLAVFVKPYALILFPWLFVARGWRAAAMAIVVVAVGLLLPAAVYGWNGNLDLLRAWLRTVSGSTAPNLLGNDNVSIAAMWAKWLGPGSLASGLAWLTVVGTLLLVIVVWERRRTVSAPEYLECALLMLLTPLISPQGWDYVLLLATPAVVCLVDRWRELTTPWQWGLGVALALMCFTMFDVMGRTLYGRFMALSLVSVCALVIAAGLVNTRWRGLA